MNIVIVLIQLFSYTIVSTTSGHHDFKQLHGVVQEKDISSPLISFKEKIDALQKPKVAASDQQLSLVSCQKTTGTSYYCNYLSITLFINQMLSVISPKKLLF